MKRDYANLTGKLFARVTNAKGANIYAIPGGRVVVPNVSYGRVFFLSGDPVLYARENTWYFPIQVGIPDEKGHVNDWILWASEAGFSIVREAP